MATDGLAPAGYRADAWDGRLAVTAGALVFGVYLATIYPGLTDIGDATKFAFVGRILGTPHPPGYPLYVMVSHVFSYVPIGNLAYRMNVLSALFGAVTVAVSYLVMRRVGVHRGPAMAAAIALGLGHAYWSRALYAKTYTLHTALVATGLLCLLRWSETRRMRDFYVAVAVFALSLGNHLTVIALIPALVLFPLVTDPRAILRVKTLSAVIAFVVAGLCQYLFILIRTRQGGPIYLEARARTLPELWSVMTASRFLHEVGAYALDALLSERVPLIAGLVLTELGVFGLCLLGVGLAVLAVRRPRHALLLGLGGLAVVALTTNMSSEEDQGFLLAAFVLFWATIAVGLQAVVDAVRRIGARGASALLLGLMVALPGIQVTANYRLNDHHTETFETEYFDALFAGLGPKVAFVQDEYRINMMLTYKLQGDQAAGSRDIRLISRNENEVNQFRRDGFTVVAFRAGRDALAQSGFNFAPFRPSAEGRAAEVLRGRELYRVTSTQVCFEIGNDGWHDLSRASDPKGRLSVRIDNYRPFDSRMVIYAGGDRLQQPILADAQGPGTPSLDVEAFAIDDSSERARLDARVAADRATLPEALLAARSVVRAEIRVNDNGEFSLFGLDFGAATAAAAGAAWVDQDEPRRATICSHPLADADLLPRGQAGTAIAWDATDVVFGRGWHPVESRPDGLTYRWTTEAATLIVPIDDPRPFRVMVAAEPLRNPRAAPLAMTLLVNGHRLESRDLAPAQSAVSWLVPADRLRAGLNDLTFEVDGAARPSDVGISADTRRLGASVTAIELADPAVSAP
jgi:hypothetical protein